ncbi:hypothetical protein VQ056_19430 [Paenibacillus sp. JTLBN-2024]
MSIGDSSNGMNGPSQLAECEAELLKGFSRPFAGQPFGEPAWEEIGGMARSGAELKLSFLPPRKRGWVTPSKKLGANGCITISAEKADPAAAGLVCPPCAGAAASGA